MATNIVALNAPKAKSELFPDITDPKMLAINAHRDTMIAAALEYAAAGVPTFPVSPSSKVPLVAWGTESSTDPAQIRRWWTQWPTALIGTPTGARSGLFVLDLDEKNGVSGSASLAALGIAIPPDAPIVHTSSGGTHTVFAWSHDLRNTTGLLGKGIDTRAEGGMVILAPSRRSMSGVPYRLASGGSIKNFLAAARACPIPPDLLAIHPKPEDKPKRPNAPSVVADVTSDYGRRRIEVLVQRVELSAEGTRRTILNNAAFELGGYVGGGEITDDDGGAALDRMLSATSLEGPEAEKTAEDAYNDGFGKPLVSPIRGFAVESFFEAPVEDGGSKAPDVPWQRYAATTKDGKPLSILKNALAAVRHHPALRDCFAYDEMHARPMLMKAIPGEQPLQAVRPVADNDVTLLQVFMQDEGMLSMSEGNAARAMFARSLERSFDPVRDYLDALRWDGKRRLYSWISCYLGAEATPYHQAIGAMFLIALVARVRQPGAKCDTMLVLEGPQGGGKSTACAILAGEWFSDALPDLTQGKDVSVHLAGKWLIEVAEMSAMSKANQTTLKSFMSRTIERYRPPFGRLEVDQPRRCVLVGTTNSSAYLRDETGGRRFWPVAVGDIDLQGLARDRDQLFAEAVQRFEAGDPWWPSTELQKTYMAAEQDARFEADAWEDDIAEWLVTQTDPVRVSDVARGALAMQGKQLGRAEQNRITAILTRLRWERLKKKDRYGNIRWERSADG